MKTKYLTSFIFILSFVVAKAQNTLFYINNAGMFGVGIPNGNFNTVQYNGNDWNLDNAIRFSGEYQINMGRLFKKLSTPYSSFFESGLRLGYQSGKVKSDAETAGYDELYIGLPVAAGLIKKTTRNIYKHSVGFAFYGSLFENVKSQSLDDKKWSFFSKPRGMIFVNTQFLIPTKRQGKYLGIGIEVSRDIGFHYKSTDIPFVIENMRAGIVIIPFCLFSD